jgi:Mrp family chromosome partitioning ATPase
MSVVAGITFVAVLIGLILLIPRSATHAAREAVARIGERPDTGSVLAHRTRAQQEIARVDSALADARRAMARPVAPPPVIDTLPPELRAERDSLSAQLRLLTRAMAQAVESPLPPAFRALAQTPALRGNAQVRSWLDSLETVDRLREPFGKLGAGDPVYFSLTARVNELGRSIRDAAALRQSELKARLAPLQPVRPSPAQIEVHIDTMPLVATRVSAQERVAAANRAIRVMRAKNAQIDSALAEARELANLGAPPTAMLAASFVLALFVGFSAAFASEMKNPRIAHPREAESVAGERVLAVVQPTEVVERGRRQTDIGAPPLIDIVSESYRTLYLHLAATGASIPIVTVTGDTPSIVATVASNLAAAAAYEARSTLLVDADPASGAVASVLRITNEPGLMGVLRGTSRWIESIVSTTIGRDRPLDVVPSGSGRMAQATPAAVDSVRNDLTRMERRYDFVVITAPTDYVQLPVNTIIPVQDVVLCARVGATELAELRSAVRSLRGVGRRLHGVVLWDDDTPRF